LINFITKNILSAEMKEYLFKTFKSAISKISNGNEILFESDDLNILDFKLYIKEH